MPAEAIWSPEAVRRTWKAALGRLEIEVNRANFETWLAGTHVRARREGTLFVEARSAFRADWLNANLRPVVERCLAAIEDERLGVCFVSPGAALEEGAGAATSSPPQAPHEGGRHEGDQYQGLVGQVNRSFTLARYFRAEGSALARASCLNLLDEEAPAISPVVVHGAPGAGKTHLLHGLAAHAREQGLRVACLSGEAFTSRYLRALREGRVGAFQDAVRGVQLLVLDDLHELAGKAGTLREFGHTLDAVTHGGGGAVVGSEVHPRELGLPERLCSRLEAGIVTAIEPFTAEERRGFIEQRLRELRVALPAWSIDQLAGVEGSARAILAGVHAAVGLQRRGLLDEMRLAAELGAREVCGREQERAPAVLDRITAHFALAAGELTSRSRATTATRARAVAAAALQEAGSSYSEIGALLGGRSRSTIKGLVERGRALGRGDAAIAGLLRAG